ncbi:minor histocompatibility antigen H13 [Favolaschia claudopus]|uniref:Minor histocompatibility antigen H13 n=1 Tax=Favolaschia claudopus TaxID=2862362 RepID=A0AAW0E0B8_9AGAR
MSVVDLDYDLLASYVGLLSLATTSIYLGAHGSLPPPRNADGTRSEEEEEMPERMSSSDAYLFPIIGSVTLVGMYLVVKYLGTAWINWLLGWYFSLAGVGAVCKSAISLARWALGEARWKSFDLVEFTIRKGTTSNAPALVSLALRTPSLFLLPLATIPSGLYSLRARSILLTDILALAFAHNALSLLKIDSFQTGCILLTGLFFYDIWWVFGTEVMVKVATNLDIPIKLMWTKNIWFGGERGFTMLGLGDVVVPGIFIALALRYDYHRAGSPAYGQRFGKPYFYAGLVAYVLGLLTTMSVMHVFGKAQPALLYLSPACIASFGVTGVLKGDLGAAWAWSDEGLSENDNEERPKTE